MNLFKNKIEEQKKKLFINSKIDFYKSIFNEGFLELVLMENFKFPELNSVISLLESTNFQNVNYRLKPSLIINMNDEYMNDSIFKERLINFFNNNIVYILFSYIHNFDSEISGYIFLTKSSFIENFHKLKENYGFIVDKNYTKFLYYNTSMDSNYLYIYEGVLEDKEFIKIIY